VILHAAEHPQREVTVFGPQQRKDEPPRPDAESGLEEAAGGLKQRGDCEG